MTQAKTRPPGFVVMCSHPDKVPESYNRYLVNGLRLDFDMPGTPIRLWMRGQSDANPYKGRKRRNRRSCANIPTGTARTVRSYKKSGPEFSKLRFFAFSRAAMTGRWAGSTQWHPRGQRRNGRGRRDIRHHHSDQRPDHPDPIGRRAHQRRLHPAAITIASPTKTSPAVGPLIQP